MDIKSLLFIPLCLSLTACSGIVRNVDVFTIKSDDYNFSIKTIGNDVVEIVENGECYSEDEMGYAKTIIEDDDIRTFYEAMYYSVYLNDNAEVKLNDEDYKIVRKELFKDKINIKSCEINENGIVSKIEFVSDDGIIQGQKIVYIIKGDFKTYKDNETINAVKNEILNSISQTLSIADINSEKLSIEIEDNKMVCTFELNNTDISKLNTDMITTIASLEINGYLCE